VLAINMYFEKILEMHKSLTLSELSIPRCLDESPNYCPDWRHQVICAHEAQIAQAADEQAALDALRACETDREVRRVLLYQHGRKVQHPGEIRYALECQSSVNAAIIKAMIVAGESPEMIAQQIGTTAANIAVFANLFFDVMRNLNNRAWLNGLFLPRTVDENPGAERERFCLFVGLHYGAGGIDELLPFHKPEASLNWANSERTTRNIIRMRMHFHVATQAMLGIPVSEGEVRLALRWGAIDRHADESDQKIRDWGCGVLGMIQTKIENLPPDDPQSPKNPELKRRLMEAEEAKRKAEIARLRSWYDWREPRKAPRQANGVEPVRAI
jgi:hypothetical protein